ncbi:amino acid transporter [Abortiporus biennis]|nr:amino acid transporter [Abortiporus biennis]
MSSTFGKFIPSKLSNMLPVSGKQPLPNEKSPGSSSSLRSDSKDKLDDAQNVTRVSESDDDELKKLDEDEGIRPGTLTLEEDAAGGMGRHLGVFSCTLLIVGRVIGTGIFSTPSSILSSVGSVGASLMLWVLGLVLSFCGLFIWLEYGTMFPRSGGEKVYLEAVYKRPKYLATVIFAANAILLGFTASGCIVFAQNIIVAAGHTAGRWESRGIALGVIAFVTILHGFTPRLGIFVMNALSVFKIVILLFVVITGWVVLGGHTRIKNPHMNFHDAFAGSSHSSNDYATATFKVLNAYAGWSNVNYVLNNVKDPIRTLKISGPLGLGICAILYLLANIAYFSAASVQEIKKGGVTVASLFFGKVFGSTAQRALSVFVALSALGVCPPLLRFWINVITITFSAARINQELAKEGIPLPFGSRFWASNWPTGKSPLPGLIVHLIPSIIVIIAPPPSVAYPFILDVEGYPQQIINFFIVIGLFWLRWKKPNAHRPFKVWWPVAVFFLAASVFLLVAPFLRPANKVGDTPPLPYYLYCLVGIGIMAFGVFYWACWRILLPRVFGYELVGRKETLDDGTVVTLFSRRKISKLQ